MPRPGITSSITHPGARTRPHPPGTHLFRVYGVALNFTPPPHFNCGRPGHGRIRHSLPCGFPAGFGPPANQLLKGSPETTFKGTNNWCLEQLLTTLNTTALLRVPGTAPRHPVFDTSRATTLKPSHFIDTSQAISSFQGHFYDPSRANRTFCVI